MILRQYNGSRKRFRVAYKYGLHIQVLLYISTAVY